MATRARALLLLAWGLAVLAVLLSPTRAAAQAQGDGSGAPAEPSDYHGFYLLPFDRYGDLTSIYERDLAIDELRRNRAVRRIFIVSYGWANDAEASQGKYLDLIARFQEQMPQLGVDREVAVFGVGWDSAQSGFRKLFNDLLPLPLVADALALGPDNVLFPLSFWSKAAMADRIGYGGLRAALNQIFAAVYGDRDRSEVPEIYLIGHSFGARVLSALMQEEVGFLPVRAARFTYGDRVRGAVLFQPALVAENLHETARYPIVVTQSRHDHANGTLFPIANLVINAYAFSGVEALIDRRVLAPVLAVAKRGVKASTRAAGRVLGGDGSTASEPAPSEEPENSSSAPPQATDASPSYTLTQLPQATFRATRRLSLELVNVPVTFAVTTVITPGEYLYTQVNGFATHPVSQLLDTLAQLPVLEIPVDGLSALTHREVPWGARGKGLFELGGINESVGRISPLRPQVGRLPVYAAAPLLAQARAAGGGCGLPVCRGVILVDASDSVHEGAFGDLRRPLVAYTVGWLDLVGAHSDYLNDDTLALSALAIAPLTPVVPAGEGEP